MNAGALAISCNSATLRQVLLDGLRKGLFLAAIQWLLYKQNLDESPIQHTKLYDIKTQFSRL